MKMSDSLSQASARIALLEADNRRLRELLAAAGRLAEVGRFAAKQNHELRQPLFAIKGLAQLLLDREMVDGQEVRDFARHIVEQSDRLTGLVGDLRHLSMPVAMPVAMPAAIPAAMPVAAPVAASAARTGRQVSQISPVLLRVAALLEWRFRHGVTLRTEIATDVSAVAIAGHQLEQILLNLLSNALDAVVGQPQATVQIRVTHDPAGAPGPRMVELLVADNGSGVSPEARPRLFENFFTTKGDDTGTGLGLAISREIARGAGGELQLLDEPGTWKEPVVTTCFRLTLPVAKEST
jgi:signal transduction histidine kinase